MANTNLNGPLATQNFRYVGHYPITDVMPKRNGRALDLLTERYAEWCEAHDLPADMSADDLLAEHWDCMTAGEVEMLRSFISLWETVDDTKSAVRSMRIAMAGLAWFI